MLAARRLLSAVGGPGFAHGRVEMSPELLFVLVMGFLMCLYGIDYSLGGEQGAASYYLGSEADEDSSQGAPAATAADSTASGLSNSTLTSPSASDSDSAVVTKKSNVAGELYSLAIVGLIAACSILFAFFLFRKVLESIRTAYFGSNGYNGTRGMSMRNRAHLEDLLGRLRGMRNIIGRDITPNDYETLLGLDRTAAIDRGAEEGMINRCPIMIITQEQIDRMTKGSKKRDDDEMPAAPSEGDGGEQRGDDEESDYACTVCLSEYKPGDAVRTLPCLHMYHTDCIDPWLRDQGDCPICKMRIDEV